MPATYDPGDSEINGRIKTIIDEYFADLKEAGVKVKVLFAASDEPPAVKHQGYAASAMIRINNLRERTLGNGDALMIVDKKAYDELTSDRDRDALMHHELHHLIVKRDKEGNDILKDDLGRPRLGMRKHDFQVGWFAETARIFGKNSPEVRQARQMVELGGEFLFPFMLEKNIKELTSGKKPKKKAAEAAEGEENK
jgi:Putative phage metallopeptidase